MKKVWLVLGFIAASTLAWYLFVHSYDTKATFIVEAYPGSVVQTLKTWSNSREDCKIIDQDSIFSIEQEVSNVGYTYSFDWNIIRNGAASSEVTVFISKRNGNVLERLAIPFINTPLESKAKELIREFRLVLTSHLDKTKVTIEGEVTFDSTFCVCVPIKTSQYGKAYGMMSHYNGLSMYVAEQGHESLGVPLVEITSWKMNSDQIEFNFCYPIAPTKSRDSNYTYKWLPSRRALKAVYNGNYITSDRAWFQLLTYAADNNLKTTKKPIEVFYDNPNFGIEENEWRADIFLPIEY